MPIEIILMMIVVVFLIGFTIFSILYDAKSVKKERVTEIYTAGSEREVLALIRRDCKKNKWDIYDITPLKQTYDYIKVIVIFEVR